MEEIADHLDLVMLAEPAEPGARRLLEMLASDQAVLGLRRRHQGVEDDLPDAAAIDLEAAGGEREIDPGPAVPRRSGQSLLPDELAVGRPRKGEVHGEAQ